MELILTLNKKKKSSSTGFFIDLVIHFTKAILQLPLISQGIMLLNCVSIHTQGTLTIQIMVGFYNELW